MAIGFFTLLDDIAVLADDVATATKVATKNTAGILGDDIAVSAEKATGFDHKRELKIIWEIIKGSLKNKLIILPLAFLLSYVAPFLITYILIGGAFYLLYEGVEAIEEFIHKRLDKSGKEKHKDDMLSSTEDNIVDIEKKNIKSAIVTDFILSIEIVIIALNSVINEPILVRVVVTSIVALIATFGVYGIVAAIVRMDDVGLWFISKGYNRIGKVLIYSMLKIIKVLAVVGTIAMILVGGEILMHNVEFIHHIFHGGMLNSILVGTIGGIVAVVIVKVVSKLYNFSIKGN